MMNKVQIAVKNLTIGYGDFVLLKDLNFNINRGDVFIFQGGSGCGKSSMLRVLTGLVAPQKGTVVIDGTDFTKAAPGGARRNHAPFGYFVPERGVVQLYDAGGKHCSAA